VDAFRSLFRDIDVEAPETAELRRTYGGAVAEGVPDAGGRLDAAAVHRRLRERQVFAYTIHQRIRFSPHLCNEPDDVKATLACL
jgi:hypothetical protein